MQAAAIILAVVGFVLAIVGARRLHRGRMRDDLSLRVNPGDSGLYTVPTSNRADLALTIIGACCGLAGAIVGVIS